MDWFEIPLLGVAETVIKLGMKSRFGDRVIAQVTLWGLSPFHTPHSAQASTAEQIF